MAKEFAKAFYASDAWQKCRADYAKSIFYLCEDCGKIGKILHHIIPLTPDNIDDPEITLNWENLKYVCKDCHELEHHPGADPLRDDVMFDSNGQLIERHTPRVG